MSARRIVALDGHDGSGKTTLARALAERYGAAYARPFGGAAGRNLMEAAEAHDVERVLSVAENAFVRALDDATVDTVVFDRSWLTVATLIPSEAIDRITFKPPTALCWANLATTLGRVQARREDQEDERWHSGYIAQYLDIANRYGCPVIRTDECTEAEATDVLAAWFETLPLP